MDTEYTIVLIQKRIRVIVLFTKRNPQEPNMPQVSDVILAAENQSFWTLLLSGLLGSEDFHTLFEKALDAPAVYTPDEDSHLPDCVLTVDCTQVKETGGGTYLLDNLPDLLWRAGECAAEVLDNTNWLKTVGGDRLERLPLDLGLEYMKFEFLITGYGDDHSRPVRAVELKVTTLC